MKRLFSSAMALTVFASPLCAQDKTHPPSPAEIVATAPAGDWVSIASSDLLVMDLAPDANGKPRRVVIQLMPPPFSQGWVTNIRVLARARWYDGTSINRVQDNYVVQWGDADSEDEAKAKKLPGGMVPTSQQAYAALRGPPAQRMGGAENSGNAADRGAEIDPDLAGDAYASITGFIAGWPVGGESGLAWPVHCYGMVGVGRGLAPDAGTGAELYVVIGHAPRHLDRNIALVGRVIEGIEHLSSLPRGTGPLGFYETAGERVAIVSVRLGDAVADLPAYEYLTTVAASFAKYADARANRQDDFFILPAGGADICNVPVPVRPAK